MGPSGSIMFGPRAVYFPVSLGQGQHIIPIPGATIITTLAHYEHLLPIPVVHKVHPRPPHGSPAQPGVAVEVEVGGGELLHGGSPPGEWSMIPGKCVRLPPGSARCAPLRRRRGAAVLEGVGHRATVLASVSGSGWSFGYYNDLVLVDHTIRFI